MQVLVGQIWSYAGKSKLRLRPLSNHPVFHGHSRLYGFSDFDIAAWIDLKVLGS